jgi:nitrile hydratase accessory protein
MTVSLSQAGHLTWTEWAAVFSAELQQSEHATPARTVAADYYYECWVRALEKLLTRKGLVSPGSLQTSLQETVANWPEPDHTARREPVARSLRC